MSIEYAIIEILDPNTLKTQSHKIEAKLVDSISTDKSLFKI